MPTPSIQTLVTDAQQVLNLDSISAVRSVVAVALANANTGTPLNPNLTTQQLWNEFYQVVTKPKSDIESIIANQLMKFLHAPPAPGGVGANGQVIFNDNGVLAGDAGLIYNKATDSLSITGDLTVDTNVLKVDSANNRVGIGTPSPQAPLEVMAAATAKAKAIQFSTTGSPQYGWVIAVDGAVNGNMIIQSNNNNVIADVLEFNRSSGNLGLGVTPSAWVLGKVFEVGQSGNAIWSPGAGDFRVMNNAFYGSGPAFKYGANGFATMYQTQNGQHQFHTAASGTAGNTISFTQAMTLDTSGNLLVGATSNITGGGRKAFTLNAPTGQFPILELGINGANAGYLYANTTLMRISAPAPSVDFSIETNAVERVRVKSTGQVRFVPLASDPSGAEAGDVYYNSTSNKLKCYNGTTWNDLF